MIKLVKSIPFRLKLILFVTILFLLLAAVQFSVTSYFLGDIISEKSQTLFNEIVSQLGTRIDTEINTRNQLIRQVTGNSSILYCVTDILQAEKSRDVLVPNIMREVLRLCPGEFYSVEDLYIFPRSGSPVNCYYTTALSEIDPYSSLILTRLINMPSNEIIWDDFYLEPEHISAYAPIENEGQIIGLLRVRFSKDFLGSIVDPVLLADDNVVLIVDESGNIIYSNDLSIMGRSESSIDQKANYIVTKPLQNNGWRVLGIIPNSSVTYEIFRWIMLLSLFYVLIFCVAVGTIVLYSNYMLKPLQHIVKGMHEIQQGNLDTVLESSTSDEFGFIIENFNYMTYRIKSQINQIYNHQLAVHRAEISNIEARLNPHFLYNTLDSIYWMLVVKDDLDEANMVIKLSDILRYSISYSNDFAPVWEDFKQLENYIALQKYRFEGQLSYSIELEDDIKNVSIPKLFMQPLVENSIRHGFRDMIGDGHIHVSGRADGENITLAVEDNGIGIEKAQLDNVLHSGLGLGLTRERIDYIYGRDYPIDICSRVGKGTRISITVSRRPNIDLRHIFDLTQEQDKTIREEPPAP